APKAVADISLVDADKDNQKEKKTFWQRLNSISETALHDFIDITVFLILGALLPSLVRTAFDRDQLQPMMQDFPATAILAMVVLAIVLCLCGEVGAFVALNQIALPGATVACLVVGQVLALRLYIMYPRVLRPGLIWTNITAVVVQVFV